MSRRLAVFVSLDIIVLALLCLLGSHRLSGPLVVSFNEDHGMHLLDVFVIVMAVGGLMAVWWPARERARGAPVDVPG